MDKIIPIIIIEFNSHDRTIKYIEDCIKMIKCNYKFSFVIVDNGVNIENYYKFNENLINKFSKNHLCKCSKIQDNIDSRVKEINYIDIGETCSVISIKAKDNYGFAIGNNIGSIVANKLIEFEYILFSNSDISFNNNFDLDKLINIIKNNSKIALVGPRVVGLDHVQQTPCERKSLWHRWNMNSIIWPLNSVIRLKCIRTSDDTMFIDEDSFVYRIIGAFMLFDYKKFLEIGMFDEGTFLYGEELIIGEKLRNLGYDTYFCNSEVLIHEQGGSTKKKFNDLQTLKLKFESEMYYYNKYRNIKKSKIIISKKIFDFYTFKLQLINKMKNLNSNKSDSN